MGGWAHGKIMCGVVTAFGLKVPSPPCTSNVTLLTLHTPHTCSVRVCPHPSLWGLDRVAILDSDRVCVGGLFFTWQGVWCVGGWVHYLAEGCVGEGNPSPHNHISPTHNPNPTHNPAPPLTPIPPIHK